MLRLHVCIPTTGLCRSEHTMSLANFCLWFMQTPIFPDTPQCITLRHYQSSSIQNGRENLVMQSLEAGASHILFIDEDIAFEADAPAVLIRRQQPLLACNYKIRFEGMPFAAIGTDYDSRIATTADSTGLEECGACGFGLALIAREVFEAMPQPWFETIWCENTRTYTTEDLPFFLKARKSGIIPLLDHDASKKIVAHVGDYRYRWNDPRDS